LIQKISKHPDRGDVRFDEIVDPAEKVDHEINGYECELADAQKLDEFNDEISAQDTHL
jgi:hypothetical protein